MAENLVTANRLSDGVVVFLDAEGGWPTDIAKARVIAPADLADALAYAKRASDAQVVVEPYEIEVTVENGVPVPVRLRERIRAAGPTVSYGASETAARAQSGLK